MDDDSGTGPAGDGPERDDTDAHRTYGDDARAARSTGDHEGRRTAGREDYDTDEPEDPGTASHEHHNTDQPKPHSTPDHEDPHTASHQTHHTSEPEDPGTASHAGHGTDQPGTHGTPDHEDHRTADHQTHDTVEPEHPGTASHEHHNTDQPKPHSAAPHQTHRSPARPPHHSSRHRTADAPDTGPHHAVRSPGRYPEPSGPAPHHAAHRPGHPPEPPSPAPRHTAHPPDRHPEPPAPGPHQALWERRVEIPLAVASLAFLAAYAFRVLAPGLPELVRDHCLAVTLAAWALFAVDYAVRWRLSGQRLRFVRTHALDTVVLLLPLLRPLRVVKLYEAVQRRHGHPRLALHARVIAYSGLSTLLLGFTGALAVYQQERHAPGTTMSTFGDAVWWTCATLTTVGYGDVTPVTALGRLIAVGVMMIGMALLAAVTGTFASWLLQVFAREDDERPPGS